VIDVLRQIYNKPVSLADIGINAERSAKIHSAVTELSPNIFEKDDRRKKLEAQVAGSGIASFRLRVKGYCYG
jgi:hypothetical protein